jgi:hypothetical protein
VILPVSGAAGRVLLGVVNTEADALVALLALMCDFIF